ncbi:hypothetical protein BKA70DRAFT_1523253 [Coprinopsis sp. MPI-PUGE-AT-0042]|nr:hypothetical protein BKA70DRAFT_1523253 [Coprinopsis sp. MPI-PUGE-AT-0042]
MDQEISQLKARLFAEEKNREETWRTRQAYAGLISPMRRLPTELLSKVLQDVLDCPRMLSSEDIPRLNSLHLVCRRWRDVVRSTPDIWTSLSVTLPVQRKAPPTAEQRRKPNWIFNRNSSHIPNIDHLIAFVDAWFDRAGTKPLRLRVDGTALYPRDSFEFDQREVAKLSFVRKRNWLQLDFYGWVDSRIYISCKRATKRTPDKNPFETVERLQLWSHPEEGELLFPSSDVPSLKSLHGVDWTTFNSSCIKKIQHEGLQSLHLSCASIHHSLLAPRTRNDAYSGRLLIQCTISPLYMGHCLCPAAIVLSGHPMRATRQEGFDHNVGAEGGVFVASVL